MSQKTERLVNVTIALLETRRPLSFTQLQQKTGYYTGQDHDAARRMFERDKDDLRSMGVPITTEPIPYSDDFGYIISRKEYELPDPAFTREEITALALAQEHATSSDVGLTFAKIAARAPDPDFVTSTHSVGLRITHSLYPPEVLAAAVVDRVTVTFTYQTPHAEPSVRSVDPYALARRRSRWYLIGFDHGRDAIRAFRVDRIIGTINTDSERGAFVPPDELDLANEIRPPADEFVTLTGVVSEPFATRIVSRGGTIDPITPDSIQTGWLSFTLLDVDLLRDLPWLLECGDQLRVTSPQHVVDTICETLTQLLNDHRDSA
ncbi:MAG: WYL domain-containing protein [Nitriliruptoraceae bacterium]